MFTTRYNNVIVIVGFLFGIGLSAHFFARPATTTPQEQVTSWLLTFADKAQTSEASEVLNAALAGESIDIDTVLEVASRVIAEHPDLFILPKNADESSDKDVLKVLIQQWNHSHESAGMAKAVQPDRNRSATPPTEFQNSKQGQTVGSVWLLSARQLLTVVPGADFLVSLVLIPLIDGISINAP
jgi:hypothetical protein